MIELENKAMEELPHIYNSRLLKLYATYLETHYPDIDVNNLLKEAQLTKLEIDDPGHWFNQDQVDRFHQKILQATGNTTISREVGRYCVATNVTGAAKQYALGLLKVSSIYLLIARLYNLLSRGASVKARKIAPNKVEISVLPAIGAKEKPYQCENRMGIFESLSTLVTEKYATIKHDDCIHHGADLCRYEVSWEESPHMRWKRYFLLGLGPALLAIVVGFLLLPLHLLPVVALLAIAGLTGVWLQSVHLERQELVHIIQKQGNVAEDHIKEIDLRYRGVLLVQKIGQATSEILDIHQLTEVVIRNIQNYLDFDRGIIMLADSSGQRLVYMAGYGFDEEKADILRKTKFRLDHSEARGVFVQAFKEQRPILVNDVTALHESFSVRSQTLVKQIGSQSLICLPIVYENQSLGILAVDNIEGKRQLTQSDMNLLMGVAYQTAVSIFSVMAHKKLQDSEERYRGLYDNAPTAYFSISAHDAAVINCNIAATSLLGHSRSQLLGSSWFDHFSADQGNRARAQWIHNALQRGQAIRNEEVKLVCKNGKTVWANLSMEPHRDTQGNVLEGRCVLIDISERKQLEEKLRHAQKMEAMGTLAGGVAHDLSNILAAIVSYPDLLLMDINSDSPMFEPLNKIKSSGMRAAAIVQDLLTLARLGLHFTDVIDLNTIVRDFIKSPECDNVRTIHPGIEIAAGLDDDLHAVRGSAVHLSKTLMNIVINAAEAMPDGGLIHISTYGQNVAQAMAPNREEGKYVVLSVQDNGTGISKEDIDRIFEPFFTKKVLGRSGTGLGMAIVWATVQDHNGFIEIESEVGKGTAVRLFFPATSEVRVQPAAVPVIEDLMGSGETILIIDDEAEHRDIATHMLTRLGYNVVAVDNAEAALDQVAKQPPDLLVLDMVLGTDIDGLAVYRRILAMRPNQKAVIISGFSETSRVTQAMELGAGAYINKPYGMKEIAAAVRKELDRVG